MKIGAYKQICTYKLILMYHADLTAYIHVRTHMYNAMFTYYYNNTLHKRMTLSESVQVVTYISP